MHRETFKRDERTSTGMTPKLDHGVTGRSCVPESGIAARQATDEVDIVALSRTSVMGIKEASSFMPTYRRDESHDHSC